MFSSEVSNANLALRGVVCLRAANTLELSYNTLRASVLPFSLLSVASMYTNMYFVYVKYSKYKINLTNRISTLSWLTNNYDSNMFLDK